MFGGEFISIEKLFHISTGWRSLHRLESAEGRTLIFLKNGAQVVKLRALEPAEFKSCVALYKHMEENLPFYGGVSPFSAFRNQKRRLDQDSKVVWMDARLLGQFANMNFYLQQRFTEDIGVTRQALFGTLNALLKG